MLYRHYRRNGKGYKFPPLYAHERQPGGMTTAYSHVGVAAAGDDDEGAWTPGEVTTKLWYDAADSDTITQVAGSVSEWRDKSGNDNHAVQLSGALQPKSNVTTVGGKSTVYFDGSKTMSYSPTGISDGPNTVFCVVKFDHTFDVNQRVFNESSLINSTGFSAGIIQGTFSYTNNTFANRVIGSAADSNTVMFSCLRDGTGQDFYEDAVVTSNASGSDFTGATMAYLASLGSSAFAKCSLCELIFVDSAVLDCMRQRYEGYLAHKWGFESSLPIDHDWRFERPLTELPYVRTIEGGCIRVTESGETRWIEGDW